MNIDLHKNYKLHYIWKLGNTNCGTGFNITNKNVNKEKSSWNFKKFIYYVLFK